MEGSQLAQRLRHIMEGLYDICNEVLNFVEDTQVRVQDVAYKLRLILEWCAQVARILHVPLLVLTTRMWPNFPILPPSGQEGSSMMETNDDIFGQVGDTPTSTEHNFGMLSLPQHEGF